MTGLPDATFASLTDRGFQCECGRCHCIPIKRIIVESGILGNIDDCLKDLDLGRKCVVIADDNTLGVAGERVVSGLQKAGYESTACVLAGTDGDIVKPDEMAIGTLMASVALDTAFLISVGSGTITDITRYVASRTGRPYVVIPTAPSMDGYSSTVSPILRNGFKVTMPAVPPVAVLVDLDVVCGAPREMIASGYGDLIGKLTAKADWVLARIINDEYYCDYSVRIMQAALDKCVQKPTLVRKASRSVIRALMEGLLLSGISILMVGHSRPASGAEHQLSHFWEMAALLHNEEPHFHGSQVGVATLVVARMYEKLLKLREDDLRRIEERLDKGGGAAAGFRRQNTSEDFEGVFGPLAPAVRTISEKKQWTGGEVMHVLQRARANWGGIREGIRRIVPPVREIRQKLESAGAARTIRQIGVDSERLADALMFARYIRPRYTVMDFIWQLGLLRDWADELVAETSRGELV